MLNDLAKQVLLAAANGDGEVVFLDELGGTSITAGDLNLKTREPREKAKHRECMEQLESNGFIKHLIGKRWAVTTAGFDHADSLKAN